MAVGRIPLRTIVRRILEVPLRLVAMANCRGKVTKRRIITVFSGVGILGPAKGTRCRNFRVLVDKGNYHGCRGFLRLGRRA